MRRAKHVRFRRQRVVVEGPPEDSAGDDPADEANEPEAEKIEVHVHLHRGERSKSSESKRPFRTGLTGALFDWQWYSDRLAKKPRPADGRWSLITRCTNCDATLPSTARRCPRCAAPRSRRRLLPIVMALIGLGSIAVVFGLCARILGGSVSESKAPAPLGQWPEDYEYDEARVEVSLTPSSFSNSLYTANDGKTSGGETKTR